MPTERHWVFVDLPAVSRILVRFAGWDTLYGDIVPSDLRRSGKFALFYTRSMAKEKWNEKR